ncbi:hypothetical protein E3E36_09665 [Thermococcus sp. M36]|uniref:COG1470 family protein n=1 Tax=Thermococcus sp. M36 TaxID=1638261 RepID=UPI0014397A82|nr:hypothetical protein [Thermococcus sp. M36]NJE06405.1 hypothetical protein [Thermococcus sp. M36]
MRYWVVPLILFLLMGYVPLVHSQPLLSITPLKTEFSGLPGDSILIPFELFNPGNLELENITVYITGPDDGFLYESRLIRGSLLPNATVTGTVSFKILNASPGAYNLTLIARVGSVYSEARVRVKVGTLVDYDVRIEVGEEYVYGSNVTVRLQVSSKSNGILNGLIGYTIERGGETVQAKRLAMYLLPGDRWVENITLIRPEKGEYRVRLWANFGGRQKSDVATFVVYQRNLRYDVRFRNGIIIIHVYDENGTGVQGIPIAVNGVSFTTGPDGYVSYPVKEPGTYEVVLNLDGNVIKTFVDVKKLFLSYEQANKTLIVTVVDSTGQPVPNVTVIAVGPEGREYLSTNLSGVAAVDLERVGYGTILLKAESNEYVSGSAVAKAVKPPGPIPSRTVPVNSTTPDSPSTPSGTSPPHSTGLGLILLVSAAIFAGSSYLAFFRPIVVEERIDRYYFIKVRAPRLRKLENFVVERHVSAVDARATKGAVTMENGVVLWKVGTLEPGEEAYLQIVLG